MAPCVTEAFYLLKVCQSRLAVFMPIRFKFICVEFCILGLFFPISTSARWIYPPRMKDVSIPSASLTKRDE